MDPGPSSGVHDSFFVGWSEGQSLRMPDHPLDVTQREDESRVRQKPSVAKPALLKPALLKPSLLPPCVLNSRPGKRLAYQTLKASVEGVPL